MRGYILGERGYGGHGQRKIDVGCLRCGKGSTAKTRGVISVGAVRGDEAVNIEQK